MSTSNDHRDMIATVAIAAAWSDGSVCDNEKRALQRIMQHLGYPPETLAERLAASAAQHGLESLSVPEDPALRLQMMRYAMAVALADGSLEDSEKDFLERLTRHLGFSPQALRILEMEAEQLAAQQGLSGESSIISRVEALLPKSAL
jgi:tellurite resistance protein